MAKDVKVLFSLILALLLLSGCTSASSDVAQTGEKKFDTYIVEKNTMDYKFIINGQLFKAKTYCLGMKQGDRVIFLEGSPDGDCRTAKIKDLETGVVCFFTCEGTSK